MEREQIIHSSQVVHRRYGIAKRVLLASAAVIGFAAGGAAHADDSPEYQASFFCQNGANSIVVPPGEQSPYIQAGYQCNPVTHKEPFFCTNGADELTVYGGRQLSTYVQLGYDCSHQ